MTEKLYYLSSKIKDFKATVVSTEKTENGYKSILSKTAFFPEGGGQPADKGTINGITVFNVLEENGEIYHYTEQELNVGDEVEGVLDWECRYDRMQNHSGEHIISGIVHSLYGYQNVGFHLSDDTVTLDFDGELSAEQLEQVEKMANEVVWRNAKIDCFVPTVDELQKLEYRSKKELDGDVRIVKIEDCDMCACCAPHVESAGEIGIIKMLDTERLRGGIRIYIKCGMRALKDYGDRYKNIFAMSNLMSLKQHEVLMGVEKLYSQINELKQGAVSLKKRLIDAIIKSADGKTVVFEDGLDVKELQLLADGLYKNYGGIKAAFSPLNNDSFSFAICGDENELNSLFKDFKASFSVRGGGRNGMVQGTVQAEKEQIEAFFK